MVGFAIHQHESATGVHVSPHPEPPTHFPPHHIPLGCPKKPALSALLHALNLHGSPALQARQTSILACRIPQTEEPGGLWSIGLQ